MKKTSYRFCLLAACIFPSVGALANSYAGDADLAQVTAVQEEETFLQHDLAYLVAPVKSAVDLDKVLADGSARNPLNALSKGGRERFVSSLKFSDRGLSSLSYLDLEAELTVSEAYKVLALFGQQHLIGALSKARVETELDRDILNMPPAETLRSSAKGPGGPVSDHNGYECAKHATCESRAGAICTSNC